MTDTLFIPYVSLLVLDEMGMSLRSSIPNPDISRDEIMGMGNFYSPVISASSPNLEIYGPLPIPHFGKYHLLIVSFRKADSENRVMRSKATDNLSFCQLLIIYDKQCDQKVKYGHSKIFDTIESFLQQFTDINQITDKNLISLSESLIENILLDEQIKSKSLEDVVRDIASRFNTIQQISNLLNRRTKIGIITSDSLSYNLIIQSLFHYQNIDFIEELSGYFKKLNLSLEIDNWMKSEERETGGIFCDAVCPKAFRNLWMIAEVSDFNPNVFFECGFAIGLGRTVIFLCDENAGRIKFKLGKLYLSYKTVDDIINKLESTTN